MPARTAPPPLGSCNTILWARARRHEVVEFPGPLSIKSVVQGEARWRVGRHRFALDQRSCAVVADGQPYSLSIDSEVPVETFVVFFERGFAESVVRDFRTGDALLLDGTSPATMPTSLHAVQVRPELVSALATVRAGLHHPAADELWREHAFIYLAEQLAQVDDRVRCEAASLPVARAAVRAELYRRLQRGIDVIEASLGDDLTLASIARAAGVSTFHFHRSFKRAFGETVHGYIRRRRIERACDLLSSSRRSISEICLDVGFSSLGSFATLFRRRTGVTPLTFRRSNLRGTGFSALHSRWYR